MRHRRPWNWKGTWKTRRRTHTSQKTFLHSQGWYFGVWKLVYYVKLQWKHIYRSHDIHKESCDMGMCGQWRRRGYFSVLKYVYKVFQAEMEEREGLFSPEAVEKQSTRNGKRSNRRVKNLQEKKPLQSDDSQMTASAVAATEINLLKCRKSAAMRLGPTERERRTFSGNTVALQLWICIITSEIFAEVSHQRARVMETPLKLQSFDKPIFDLEFMFLFAQRIRFVTLTSADLQKKKKPKSNQNHWIVLSSPNSRESVGRLWSGASVRAASR